MSDESTAPTAAEIEVMRSTVAGLKAERDAIAKDRDALRQDRDAQLGAVNTMAAERNTLASQIAERDRMLADLGKERDAFKQQHGETLVALTDITQKTRERDVLDGLAAAFPGADRTVIKGAVLVAVEEKKAERYPEDPAKAVAALAELLKPQLSRSMPVNGGGPPQQQVAPQRAASPGIWGIGARAPASTP